MSSIEALRKETDDLLKTLTRIGFRLRLGGDRSGTALHHELSEIARVLSRHLREEEQEISSDLDHSKQILVRQLSKASHRELDELDHRLEAFLHRWPDGAGIDADHAAFVQEASQLVEAVRRRLSEELVHLFPAAQRSVARPHY